MNFVLDASVALLWLAPESNPSGVDYAAATMAAIKQSQAVVPSLLALEIANVVAKLESKGVVSEVDSQRLSSCLADSTSALTRRRRCMPWAIP